MRMEPAARFPALPAELLALAELALDLRWSWSHASDALWHRIAPDLWERTRNPLLVLQNAGRERLHSLAAERDFVALLDGIIAAHKEWRATQGWFQAACPATALSRVAYFSMEFGLSESLPIYSGGLGILAGDCLKTASDLHVPMTGIGLLWQQGYFRQSFDAAGRQQEFFPYNDLAQLPVQPVFDAEGEPLRVELPFPGRQLLLRAWRVQVGRVCLYLLDSNDPLNAPADRGITAELYGGGSEMRLRQEICLGVGGWLLLRALRIHPEVCHLNEGHAAFAVLARAATHLQDHGGDFRCALNATRAGNVFTTHTPVAAGIDRFPPDLLARYMEWAQTALGVPAGDIIALGRERPEDDGEPFNMAYLAIRGSLFVNGVSQLHGSVSRRIFQPLFPRWPEDEVPVTHVTNGVHMPSWDSAEADRLWTETCGKGRWLGDLGGQQEKMCGVTDQVLWEMRTKARQRLISFARGHLERQLAIVNAPPERLARARNALDPNALVLGFARRFTGYKRPTMLLADPDRLYRMLTHPQFPVQLILAGKAHPQDEFGKAMVRQWNEFIDSRPEITGRVVFLADYDMLVAEQLVQGVDLWINTPRRPWEACGTSGMKVLVNGGLNLSELDGWWAAAFAPDLGWAIGDGQEHGAEPAWEKRDADQLYRVLEEDVIPLFYRDRDAQGCPRGWVARIRQSMSTLTPRFSSNRMLREYVERLYLPAAAAFAARQEPEHAGRLCAWQEAIERHWDGLHFGELRCEADAGAWQFSIAVYLGELDAGYVAVQLHAMARGSAPAELHAMQRGPALAGAVNGFTYTASIPGTRSAGDYTPRAVPALEGARVPLEASRILWLR